MKTRVEHMEFILNESTLRYTFRTNDTEWRWHEDYEPYFLIGQQKIKFRQAEKIDHSHYASGLGEGIRSHFEGFVVDGVAQNISFDTLVWVERNTMRVHLEWIPLFEEKAIDALFWPGEMSFDENRADWYTLLTAQQGLLIPNDWPVELEPIHFDGMFNTAGAYMPWYAQVKEGAGYLAVCTTPWDAGYQATHPESGGFTHVGMRFFKSLGSIGYRRQMYYEFLEDCDYTKVAKAYLAYAKETGRHVTLDEKRSKLPQIDELIGTSFVHMGIKTYVEPDSRMYDSEDPSKNNRLVPFFDREKDIQAFHDAGVEKLYLHLDGWADPGYDNKHPDYLPACIEAGGWEGMRSLSETTRRLGYQFGIHDQYRDYYFRAPSFDEQFACRLEDGSIPTHAYWAGGKQTYLCTTKALGYVKRNFSEIQANGVALNGAYLDVFTCNEGDECFHPDHRMSRKESYEHRQSCFQYLISQGIMPSSEEVNDWAMPTLVFCHYAPYDFMLRSPGAKKYGIPVPLYNLVYHDCVVVPWMMDRFEGGEDYMLYALCNGGAPYLRRDAAYANIDGAFGDEENLALSEQIERCRIVQELHERVGRLEMTRHDLMEGDPYRQRTVFADGTVVEIDLHAQTAEIRYS